MGTLNFDKTTAQPCMKHGNQKSKDYLATPTRNEQEKYPSTGAAQQAYPEGNDQSMMKSKSSALMGDVKCGGKAKFPTEMDKTFVSGGPTGSNTSTRYMSKKGK